MSVEEALSAVKKAEESGSLAMAGAAEKAREIVEAAKKNAAEKKKASLSEAEKKRREMIERARDDSARKIKETDNSAQVCGSDPEKAESAVAAVVDFLRGD